MSLNNNISQNDSNQTQLEQDQLRFQLNHTHNAQFPSTSPTSSNIPSNESSTITTSINLENQLLFTQPQQSLLSMDGTHGHLNINADVGNSDLFMEPTIDEPWGAPFAPQQFLSYEMLYSTTDYPSSFAPMSLHTFSGNFHQRTDDFNDSQLTEPQPSFQLNDAQLRRKRKADDKPLSDSNCIKKEHLDNIPTVLNSSQDTNADCCSYFPENNPKLSIDSSFQFPETFVPEKSHLMPYVGQMLMVGLVDDKINDNIRNLITKYHVGSIILSSRNMKGMFLMLHSLTPLFTPLIFFSFNLYIDAESTRALILELQQIANAAKHEHPLLIAIDQENGMLNNLYDKTYLSQFPGNMAMVATGEKNLAKDVARAMGSELKALGINWILGPVVDVLTNPHNRLLGVRTMGDDPDQVSDYAEAFLDGYKEAGIATCGKHFPGYGNATVDSSLGFPVVSDSLEQLEAGPLIPYKRIIQKNVDAIMVGGCALPTVTMGDMHACLSEKVVQEILRNKLKHNGVVVSECLEMKSLYENVGVRQGTAMAASAGCDVIIVCSSYRLQLEAISGILGGVRDEIFTEKLVMDAAKRVTDMKKRYLSWETALAPPELSYIQGLKKSHQELSSETYKKSVTLLRDHSNYIPLTESVERDGNILLLTPLVSPIINVKKQDGESEQYPKVSEEVFKEFGMTMARFHTGKIQHTTYTAKGFQGLQIGLFEKAKAVIVVTTGADRNQYQLEFTKKVSLLCSQQRKPMIAIAASSPYDLALDRAVGTYMCIYEFTQESLEVTANILFNKLKAVGKPPGRGLYQEEGIRQTKERNSRKGRWLVEDWNEQRDISQLKDLWSLCFPERRFINPKKLFNETFGKNGLGQNQKHFVVRNSSTREFYGFCSTWIYEKERVGSIMMLFVIPSRRCMSIGQSLHDAAIKYLKKKNVTLIRLGSRFPQFFEGMPINILNNEDKTNESGRSSSETSNGETFHVVSRPGGTVDLVEWFNSTGWKISAGKKSKIVNGAHANEVHTMLANVNEGQELATYSVVPGFTLRTYTPEDETQLLEFVDRHVKRRRERAGLRLLYTMAQKSQVSNEADTSILVYIDMTGKIIGSIILFSMQSNFSKLLPWIYEFEDARVGGLCGLVVEETKLTLDSNVVKQDLLAEARNNFLLVPDLERCAISGIEAETDYKILVNLGFKKWKSYLEVSRNVKELV